MSAKAAANPRRLRLPIGRCVRSGAAKLGSVRRLSPRRLKVRGYGWASSSDGGHDRSMSDDELANDRTFLAWLRTGIALYGLGFVVAKVALIVQPNATVTNEGLYAAVGIAFVLCGAALILVGYLHHHTVLDHLRTDNATPRRRWPLTITATAVAAGLLLSVLVAVSS